MFYAYHWLIRPDGSIEHLLPDNEVGWHSGNWNINCRSIAICFDGDYSKNSPSDGAIQACAKLIANYATKLSGFKVAAESQLIGHFDVRNTACPGTWFRSDGKQKLLELAGLK